MRQLFMCAESRGRNLKGECCLRNRIYKAHTLRQKKRSINKKINENRINGTRIHQYQGFGRDKNNGIGNVSENIMMAQRGK